MQAGFPRRLPASLIRLFCGIVSGEALVNSRPAHVLTLVPTEPIRSCYRTAFQTFGPKGRKLRSAICYPMVFLVLWPV
jgi:hypothetical protein